MEGVLIRQAGPSDGLLVAALTIQAARAAGQSPEAGFLDRYAEAWLAQRDAYPTWWAEFDRQHAGFLVAHRVRPLPWPGSSEDAGTLRFERVFVRPEYAGSAVADALHAAAREWAAARGIVLVPES